MYKIKFSKRLFIYCGRQVFPSHMVVVCVIWSHDVMNTTCCKPAIIQPTFEIEQVYFNYINEKNCCKTVKALTIILYLFQKHKIFWEKMSAGQIHFFHKMGNPLLTAFSLALCLSLKDFVYKIVINNWEKTNWYVMLCIYFIDSTLILHCHLWFWTSIAAFCSGVDQHTPIFFNFLIIALYKYFQFQVYFYVFCIVTYIVMNLLFFGMLFMNICLVVCFYWYMYLL